MVPRFAFGRKKERVFVDSSAGIRPEESFGEKACSYPCRAAMHRGDRPASSALRVQSTNVRLFVRDPTQGLAEGRRRLGMIRQRARLIVLSSARRILHRYPPDLRNTPGGKAAGEEPLRLPVHCVMKRRPPLCSEDAAACQNSL